MYRRTAIFLSYSYALQSNLASVYVKVFSTILPEGKKYLSYHSHGLSCRND